MTSLQANVFKWLDFGSPKTRFSNPVSTKLETRAHRPRIKRDFRTSEGIRRATALHAVACVEVGPLDVLSSKGNSTKQHSKRTPMAVRVLRPRKITRSPKRSRRASPRTGTRPVYQRSPVPPGVPQNSPPCGVRIESPPQTPLRRQDAGLSMRSPGPRRFRRRHPHRTRRTRRRQAKTTGSCRREFEDARVGRDPGRHVARQPNPV